MCRAQCVLALVALYVGVARSWEFAVSSGDQLIFHTNNGTETGRVCIPSRNLTGLAYDVVHNRMLYIDKHNNNDTICGYNLSSIEHECYIGRSGRNILSIAYDPVTEKLFFTDANENSINWVSLKHGYENNIYGNLLIKMDDRTPDDIAVDSCRGYIYWANKAHGKPVVAIERARFSGEGRGDVLDINYEDYDVSSLTIDPMLPEIFYFDYYKESHFMCFAYMNVTNERMTYLRFWSEAKELTASKEYVYFVSVNNGKNYKSVWQLSKKRETLEEISKFYTNGSLGLATNYKIDDQISRVQNCDSLSNLLTTIPKVSCTNYCFQGDCSVNDEGLPECSCNVGYAGERCEVSACHGYCLNDGECSINEEDKPVCQCLGNHEGTRCEADVTDTTPTYDLAKRNQTVVELFSIWG